MPERRATPPRPLRRGLLRLLPRGDWSREFVVELDREYALVRQRRGRLWAAAWYAAQVVAPDTLRFVVQARRRRRGEQDLVGGGEMGTGRGRRGAGIEGWMRDLQQVMRGLFREPRFTLFVAATLALGISANAAAFGVADRMLVRGPEGVRAPKQLVRLLLRFDEPPLANTSRTVPWIPYLTALAIREQSTTLDGVVLYRRDEVLVETPFGASPLQVCTVSGDYFPVLGAVPQAGRLFGGSADAQSQDGAVISHQLWMSVFDGRESAIGQRVRVRGQAYTIVGVTPRGFTGPRLKEVDVWIPLDPSSAGNQAWWVIGRVRPGSDGRVDPARATDEATAIHRRTDPGRFFQWAKSGVVVAAPLSADDAGRAPVEASVVKLLVAVAALVLFVAIANVVNLLLARLSRRRREIGVRLALGVGRWRLARLLLAETMVLALLGGMVSVPATYLAGSTLRRILLPGVPWPTSPIHARALGVTLAAVVAAGLLVALLPVQRANRTDVAEAMRGGQVGTGKSWTRLPRVLAVCQLTLSAGLAVVAGLFLRSFWTMRETDLGLSAEEVSVVTMQYGDPGSIRLGSDAERTLYVRAMEAIRDVPQVTSAAVTLGLPYRFNFGISIVVPGVDSVPALPGGGPYVSGVTRDYFDAIGTRLLQGRSFTDAEIAGNENVVVVGATMADLLWPKSDPLGKCVRVGNESSPCAQVIGVAQDVHRVGYREPPSYQYYLPLGPGDNGFGGMALVLHHPPGRPPPSGEIRVRIHDLDPAIAYVDIQRLDDALAPQIRPWRMGSWTLGASALLAVLVSLVGVYALLSYLVEQRRREIGVRIALGATPPGIHGLVMSSGLTSTALGLVGGVAAVALARRWVAPLLFETSVLDAAVLGVVAAMLVATSAVACALPAVRAARTDPATCLKEE